MEEQKINRAVEHPVHYCQYDVEVLEMMERIWGREEVMSFCKLNAFKYRMRAGHKEDTLQDMEKEQFYLEYLKELKNQPYNPTEAEIRLNDIKRALETTSCVEDAIKGIKNALADY